MLTYVFPGQGSQYQGMGESLFDRYAELTQQADELLGYSIKALCVENQQQLNLTEYTQPAMYTVNALSYLNHIETTGRKPDYMTGHSLGEYNALFAANAFDFITGLALVKKRGELMSQASGGGMAAIIGLNETQINDILAQYDFNSIDIANYNSPQQFVISGLANDIERAKDCFEQAGAKMYIPLKVSAAFHSRYMKSAQEIFSQYLKDIVFSKSTVPVIANFTAKPYELEQVADNLTQQISNSVKWTDSINFLLSQGEMEFKEIGPGKVLTGLIRQIQKSH